MISSVLGRFGPGVFSWKVSDSDTLTIIAFKRILDSSPTSQTNWAQSRSLELPTKFETVAQSGLHCHRDNGLASEVANRRVQKNCFLRIVFQRKLFFSWPTSSSYASCLTPGLGVSHGNIMVHAVNASAQTATEGGQGEPGLLQIILGYHLMASVLFMFMDGDVLGADCICSPMGSWHSRKYFCTRLFWCSWASGIFYFLINLSRDGMPRYPGDDRHFQRELKVN